MTDDEAPVEIAALAQEAACARLRTLAAASGAAVRHGEGWFAVRTGVDSNDMNGVVSEAGAPITRRLVDELTSWFAGTPASWLTLGPNAGLTEVLLTSGARPERTGRWSGRRMPFPLPAATSGVTVSVVDSLDGLDMWLDVAAECGWTHTEDDRRARRSLYASLLGNDQPLTHWLALDATQPVGFASSYQLGQVVDLCNLAVLPSRRREGIGRALISARLAFAATQGATAIVSAPSPEGWAIQRTLGFESAPVTPDTTFYLPTST